MALTKRQKQVLDFVSDFVERNGYSPSYEELAEGLGLASLATVHKHVLALETKQYLTRSYNQSRSLGVSPKYLAEQRQYQHTPPRSNEVPLLGKIAAGTPVESFENQETLNFEDYSGNENTYALQVRGDSMIDDHICNGDFVLVQRAERVRDGEIVVALVNDAETTLKRFYDEGEAIRLQPANSTMGPIMVPRKDVQIQGRVLAVLRKYR